MESQAATNVAHQIAFLPWLRLKTTYHVAGVDFMPLRDAQGATPILLTDLVEPLRTILSSYVDRKGQPIDNCVVATTADRGWNLSDFDFETVDLAAALLFLASWACNDYFPRWPSPYVNSSSFRVIWQCFSDSPISIALISRRRDGRNLGGGYKHGEVKFSAPLQCSFCELAKVDEALLKALNAGNAANCETLRRLRYALPFVSLANTDDDLMAERAEAILMGSAFEQLLGGGSAYKLGRKFGILFRPYGNMTVDNARKVRPDIAIDTTMSERAAAQQEWWVHRKWFEELYDLRSKAVHKGTASVRSWGWSLREHLLMAAWVFPLAVKLLLQRDGHYTFSDHDKVRGLSVDKLLAVTDWDKKTENGKGPYKWDEIVSTPAMEYNLSIDRFLEKYHQK